MLTAKQEKFVQNLVKGMSQREAYKNSYNASNMKDNVIDNKACALFKQDEIRVRYEELIKATAKATIMSVQERMELLTKIAKGELKHTSYSDNGEAYENEPYISDKMKAIDTLNKMDGVYIQRVQDITPPKIVDDI